MSTSRSPPSSNGLRVAVDAMPEVESASLGIWVACGTRHETAELNGMAHMLEHMAFKGTRTRSRPRHRRGDRERRRQPERLYRPRDHRLLRLGAEGGRGAGRRDGGRHPAQLGVRSRRAAARARRHPAGDRPGARHARRHDLRPVPGDRAFPASRSAGRCWAPPRSVEAIGRDDLFAYLARHYTAVQHGAVGGRAASSTTRSSSWPRSISARCRARRPTPMPPVPLAYVGGDGRETRDARAGASRAGLRGHRLSRSRLLRARRSIRPCSAAACPRACSSASARSAAWSTASTASTPPTPTAACSASMPAPARTSSPSWCRRCARSSPASPTR